MQLVLLAQCTERRLKSKLNLESIYSLSLKDQQALIFSLLLEMLLQGSQISLERGKMWLNYANGLNISQTT